MADLIIDQWDGSWWDEQPHDITCKYCLTENLEWDIHEGSYRLFDSNGVLHICTFKKFDRQQRKGLRKNKRLQRRIHGYSRSDWHKIHSERSL